MKKSFIVALMMGVSLLTIQSCKLPDNKSADQIDTERQDKLVKEAQAETGMPDIHNFTEKKMVKMLYELRDSPNLRNYAYLWSEVTGKLVYLGQCVGYGIPYSTQYSNPEKEIYEGGYQKGFGSLPQAEPNGLYMPSTSSGTWIMLINPNNPSDIKPVYVEPNVIVSPFKLK
jgi:hypothetical protein